jgi:putative heme-binding domain-containing protein
VVPADPLPPAGEKKAFRLPPGFEAQLVAAEPDIHKPLNLAFDDRGRLWLTDTVEYPFPAPSSRKPRDTVKILEDFGPDGRARKITTWADGLNIPIGLLPLSAPSPQEALVYSIPNIYRLRDTTGKGLADHKELLYGTYGFRDTHGMTSAFTWGFDGWVYACHGYSNTSTVKGADGRAVTMQSGNTYRLRPDGSRLEQFTWGQVNPFGLAFDPLGNLYSADCHSQPVYQLLRGGYYPSFGKPHDGLGFAPEMFTGYKGSTAISGIVYYAADRFPAAYQNTLFIGDVMTNEIVQFKVSWHGASPRAVPVPFLESTDRWFRPVDIKLGPDGALYVADFYNRIIGHYEVPLDHPGRDRERGRIWRIVYKGEKGQPGTPAPRQDWTKAGVQSLVADLAHPNLTVRTKATNQLVLHGREGVEELTTVLADRKGPAHQRAHALWALERVGALDEKTLVQAARDEEAVRVHVQRVLSERPKLTPAQQELALAGLKDASPHVQKAAADALGRHPGAENVRPLLALRHTVPAADTHLLHVVRMALRDQLRSAAVYDRVEEQKPGEADRRALADVSLGVPSAASAHFLLGQVRHATPSVGDLTRFAHHIARYGSKEDARAVIGECRRRERTSLLEQVALFRAIEKGTAERAAALEEEARTWAVGLTEKALASRNPKELQAGIELTALLRLTSLAEKLLAVALDKATPDAVRGSALTGLLGLDARKHAASVGKVLAGADYAIAAREQAATALGKANQPATREELVKVLPTAPARLQKSIAAALAGSREGAELLLAAIEQGKASARLLQERSVAVPLANSKLPGGKERIAKLTAGLPTADKKVQDLIASRRAGFDKARREAGRGEKVFEKHCAACHQVNGKGARIGPQLDGVGLRGLDRLLEDVLDPNRNVDQAFRTTVLTLKKGQIVSGLLLREEGAVLVMADAQGKEVRVPAKEVEERSVSSMSPMPANFADLIPEPEFHDLMMFLLELRVVREKK